jgi:hypothetical protein
MREIWPRVFVVLSHKNVTKLLFPGSPFVHVVQKWHSTSDMCIHTYIVLYCSVLLHCVDPALRSTSCRLCATSINIYSSSSLYFISLHVSA